MSKYLQAQILKWEKSSASFLSASILEKGLSVHQSLVVLKSLSPHYLDVYITQHVSFVTLGISILHFLSFHWRWTIPHQSSHSCKHVLPPQFSQLQTCMVCFCLNVKCCMHICSSLVCFCRNELSNLQKITKAPVCYFYISCRYINTSSQFPWPQQHIHDKWNPHQEILFSVDTPSRLFSLL